MSRCVVQLVSFGVELSCQSSELFLGEQVEAHAAGLAAPGSESAEIAGGHGGTPTNRGITTRHHVILHNAECFWLFLPSRHEAVEIITARQFEQNI
jgi:hypothetical protein